MTALAYRLIQSCRQKPHELTPEEDEKLKELKAKTPIVPWKDIAAEMGKPQNVLREHWKVINPDKAGGDGGDKNGEGGGDGKKKNGGNGGEKKEDAKPADEKKDEEPKKLTKAQKRAAKQEGNTKQQEAAKAEEKTASKPASKSGSKTGSEARFTMNEWVTLQEDDLFSFGELQLLSELIAQYDTGRWQMVASRFFDKTGRRVHADDVRDKFLGALG